MKCSPPGCPATTGWPASAGGGTPVRWLLLDGYVYDIRDDQDRPPWQKGRWAVNEWRPLTIQEMEADPLDPA